MRPRPVASSIDVRTVRRFGWTRRQRRTIAMLVLIACVPLAYRLWTNPVTLGDPLPDRPPLHDELADRIDPNVATVAQLGALPGIGPSKAEAIVAYRDARPEDEIAFRKLEDLQNVRGIGPAIAAKLRPHLMFPE